MSDTPDRKRHEDELRRLNRLYSVLSEVNHAMVQVRSGDKLLQRICQSTVAYGGLTLAWIGWLDQETGEIVRKASAGEPREYLDTLHASGGDKSTLATIAIREGKAAVWNGSQAGVESDYPLAEKAGLRSAAAVPICSKGRLVGALTVYAHELNFFGNREIDLLGRMAVDVSFGLDHLEQEAKREAALNYERDLLRALMDNSTDHIYFKDINSRFIRCSKAMCDRFGTTTQDIIGKTDADFFEEEHAKDAFEDEQVIMRTGKPLAGKVEKEVWKRGEESWVLTAKIPFRNVRNEVIGTLGISKDFTAIKKAETDLEQLHKQLLETSRLAGMAEVATSVLQNVGNVLNSVNASSALISDKVRTSKVDSLAKVASLLKEQSADLPGFFANDPKGKELPVYLADLARHLAAEREEILRELQLLASNVEHIKEIVSMRQTGPDSQGATKF